MLKDGFSHQLEVAIADLGKCGFFDAAVFVSCIYLLPGCDVDPQLSDSWKSARQPNRVNFAL